MSQVPSNKHAIIRSRIDRKGRIRTETAHRDSGLDVAVSTDLRNNSTRVFIDLAGRDSGLEADLELNGSEALTLYRALKRHYARTGNGALYT